MRCVLLILLNGKPACLILQVVLKARGMIITNRNGIELSGLSCICINMAAQLVENNILLKLI